MLGGAGTASTPVFTFVTDTDTGMRRQGADSLSLIAGAVEGIRVTESGSAITIILNGTTQIKQVITETTVAANVIAATECGTTFFLDDASGVGYASTLPAAVDGCRFKFIVHTPVGTTDYTVATDSGDDVITGLLNEGNTNLACDTEDLVEFDNAAGAAGDWIEVVSDGTLWFLEGQSFGAGFTCSKT